MDPGFIIAWNLELVFNNRQCQCNLANWPLRIVRVKLLGCLVQLALPSVMQQAHSVLATRMQQHVDGLPGASFVSM